MKAISDRRVIFTEPSGSVKNQGEENGMIVTAQENDTVHIQDFTGASGIDVRHASMTGKEWLAVKDQRDELERRLARIKEVVKECITRGVVLPYTLLVEGQS
jgi:hypothetical protein